VAPVLRGYGVMLDQYTGADIAAHVAGEDEATARRFGWWPRRSTEETVRRAFEQWASEWRTLGATRSFAVREGRGAALVGGCELRIQPDGSGQVSWWIHAGERNKGYATGAVKLLVQYARSIAVDRLEAHVAEDNVAFRRVAEKAGFELVGRFVDKEGTPMVRYQLGSRGARA
jgi:RimJ/RimL family protein N-acetyltransferase